MKKYLYNGKEKFRLDKVSTNETSLCKDRKEAEAKMAENNKKINELQDALYADKKEGVIFLFQAMDAAGKDGTIRAVLTCLSPHGVYEAAFKAPTSEELGHDYLWRIAKQVPQKGEIAIFNRSQYEDVLIGKVKSLYETQAHAERIDLDKVIENRYEDINNFEKYLYRNSIRTVKIFLNVSKNEQAERFLNRIQEPEKHWKFSSGDYEERKYWDAYQKAFEDAINATATEDCPWYVVPADHKWYMRYVVSEIILSVLEDMAPKYPKITPERLEQFQTYKDAIEGELAGTGRLEKRAAKEAEAECAPCECEKEEKAQKKQAKKERKAAEKALKAAEKEAKKAQKAAKAEE